MINTKDSEMAQPKICHQLHLIQEKIEFNQFKHLLKRMATKQDSILFLNDSLFMLLENDFHSNEFFSLTKDFEVLCIDEQINARGISKLVADQSKFISYQEFVRTCQLATKVVSW